MAYDEQLGTIVVFGGQKVNTLYGDTWVLGRLGRPASPLVQVDPALAVDKP